MYLSVVAFKGEITDFRKEEFVVSVIGSNTMISFGLHHTKILNLRDILKRENVSSNSGLIGKHVYVAEGVMEIVPKK